MNWHDSYNLLIKGKKGFLNSRMSQGDMFYRLFLSDACLGKACYERCKYKYDQSAADIRIGDAWGFHYDNDEKGVSVAIAFTEKGNEVLRRCNCELERLPFDMVAEGQMKTCLAIGKHHDAIMCALSNPTANIHTINQLIAQYEKQRRNLQRIKHPLRTIKNIIKNIKNKL